ncbi:MAG: T9SS type A sorting domain-containing protein [Ignavibacteriaceae bacterium]|nr:T9SS type A sorting domain-containing protein [Ignavibacteriaceae bacterium]
MKKIFLLFFVALFFLPTLKAQSDITAVTLATYNAYAGDAPEPTVPYYDDLGVRRVIVADADGDGTQEIITTDYTNGGRVHVMKIMSEGTLEIIWSSPVSTTTSGSTPRFPQVGDCDGDGNPEIIFEQNGEARIALYEWDGVSSWGTEPAFEITTDIYMAAGALEGIRFTRETLLVTDLDGDGKSEIIAHGSLPQRDVYILGIDGLFPGFASLVIEGGHPDDTPNARNWAGGSYWSSTPADINGDGQIEIINHHWDNFGMWAIRVDGPDSYTYPDTTRPGVYHSYASTDALSYFGLTAVDVNGDGRHEIAGTMYQFNHDMCLFEFKPEDSDANLFFSDPDSVANRFAIIAKSTELAALAGKTGAVELWPCVKGDVNKDGNDEIYTGGGRGLNLIAVQYNGTGSLLDKNNYTANLVYTGEGGDVFATINIYHGSIDTVIVGPDTTYIFNPSVVDTTYEETPFTAYIFADSVDLDEDGTLEIVLSEQSVYDSTEIVHWVWVDSTKSWDRDLEASEKIINEYRKTVRVLEYTGATGFADEGYAIITPDDYKLEQNYPNPFNPNTLIKFSLPIQKNISLKIYDMLGSEVATLINNQVYEKGNFEVTWNGTNKFGSKVASGNYIATLTYGNFSKSIKMTLLK